MTLPTSLVAQALTLIVLSGAEGSKAEGFLPARGSRLRRDKLRPPFKAVFLSGSEINPRLEEGLAPAQQQPGKTNGHAP